MVLMKAGWVQWKVGPMENQHKHEYSDPSWFWMICR